MVSSIFMDSSLSHWAPKSWTLLTFWITDNNGMVYVKLSNFTKLDLVLDQINSNLNGFNCNLRDAYDFAHDFSMQADSQVVWVGTSSHKFQLVNLASKNMNILLSLDLSAISKVHYVSFNTSLYLVLSSYTMHSVISEYTVQCHTVPYQLKQIIYSESMRQNVSTLSAFSNLH